MTSEPDNGKTKSVDILRACHDLAVEHLSCSIKQALSPICAELNKIADKAANSHRRNHYVDAAQELLSKNIYFEEDVVAKFREQSQHALVPINKRTLVAENTVLDTMTELSLVDSNEMEESLAVTNFIENLKGQCREDLFALECRTMLLLGDTGSSADSLPFGPQAIGNAFKHACGQLAADVEIKCALYKLIGRFTASDLRELYRALNSYLIKCNILPSISMSAMCPRYGQRKSFDAIDSRLGEKRSNALTERSRGNRRAYFSKDAPSSYAAIKSELTAPVCGTSANVRHTQTNGAYSPFNERGSQTNDQVKSEEETPGHADTSRFVETLTQIQNSDLSMLYKPNDVCVGRPRSKPQAGTVNVLHTLRDSDIVGDISESDGTILDIIAMLFDFIFDDKSIPDFMKALIGKLQIPVLKVALLDKSLLSSKTHPARKLIDLLANSSIGLVDSGSDAQYAKFTGHIVQYIVKNFTYDIEIFNAAAKKLEEFLTQEAAQFNKGINRSASSLNAREQIVHAKCAVDKALQSRLAAGHVPEFIVQFAKDYWRQLLIITYIDHGYDSDEWRAKLQTIDTLIWSVSDKRGRAQKPPLATISQLLLQEIRAGMKALDMDRKVCSKFLSMLASVHAVNIKKEKESASGATDLLLDKVSADISPQRDTANALRKPSINNSLQHTDTGEHENDNSLALDPSLFEDDGEVEDIDVALLPRIKNLNTHLATATSMDLGDWVEFDKHDGTTKRARFTWISPFTGRYLFTDQRGQKSMDATLGKLAELFSNGSARRIESRPDPLFDRALDDLMGRLATA